MSVTLLITDLSELGVGLMDYRARGLVFARVCVVVFPLAPSVAVFVCVVFSMVKCSLLCLSSSAPALFLSGLSFLGQVETT